MTDLETAIRDALRARADAVTVRRAGLEARRRRWVAPVLAAAVVVAVAAISLALVGRDGHPSTPAAASRHGGTPGYVGHRWDLVAIDDRYGHAVVPAGLGAMITFDRDGTFGLNDTVNYYSGKYRVADGGYSMRDIGGTLAGFAGSPDSRTGRIIGAMRMAMGYDPSGSQSAGNVVPVRVRGTVLTIGTGADRATFARSAPASGH